MRTDIAQTTKRQDYTPYPFRLKSVRLEFDLDAERTRVKSTLEFSNHPDKNKALRLDGEDLELIEIHLNGQLLSEDYFVVNDDHLLIHGLPSTDTFTLSIINYCHPRTNTKLMGLYESGNKLFTQCEAEGFRRITWFPDRPDVMSCYEVILRADAQKYPYLLSNGNLIEQNWLADGRQQVVWRDPQPKPSYLFALVAGNFDCLERTETTRSGRKVLLQVYSDTGRHHQTHWAMDCLVRALHWDEQRFGLELDLDRFMIVAARDFNMGAMENKGLNIFNASYVLADPQTATDESYRRIEAVIGHEYFHNWTGNRVTCRDWFQLSLKEGLTVFREQEFSADMLAQGLPPGAAESARAVKRIDDVQTLRSAQFPEDASPMAHPIRPESYQEITNFYTPTIYEKGAEVIRMQHTLLGEQGFQQGMREYFRKYDGQAATCDDFVDVMSAVYGQQHPGKDFTIFRRWYEQAGTPRIRVHATHDAKNQSLQIRLEQRCERVGLETRETGEKPSLHIPFAIGLLNRKGQAMAIHQNGQEHDTVVLDLVEAQQSWTFNKIPEQPVLSLLRGFSAPVIVESDRSTADLQLLACHDIDHFARWDAMQDLAFRVLANNMPGQASDETPHTSHPASVADLVHVWKTAMSDHTLSPDYQARLLAMPGLRELIEHSCPIDPRGAFSSWMQVQQELGQHLSDEWHKLYDMHKPDGGNYSPDPLSAGKRRLRLLALNHLLAAQDDAAVQMASSLYEKANNMTESLGALSALQFHAAHARPDLLAHFHQRWKHDPQVLDNWFALQAGAPQTDVEQIRQLMRLPEFSLRNPNRARAVVFRFCLNNPKQLHTPKGYDFWIEQVLAIDQLNPEIAARLARAFDNWARHEPQSRQAMHQALQSVQQAAKLSRNVQEIVRRALG